MSWRRDVAASRVALKVIMLKIYCHSEKKKVKEWILEKVFNIVHIHRLSVTYTVAAKRDDREGDQKWLRYVRFVEKARKPATMSRTHTTRPGAGGCRT